MRSIVKFICVWTSLSLPVFAAASPGLGYATFLGGSGDDSPTSIARDASGNIYVGGSTNSRDLVGLKANQFPPLLHGEQQLCFVSRLGADGTKVDFSEIVPLPSPGLEPLQGMSRLDRGRPIANGECRITAIDVDLWGTLYVAGITTLVQTGDANHPASVPEGTLLGFVEKLQARPSDDPSGPGLTLQWSRLFGDVAAPSGDPLHPASSITAINALKTTPGGDIVIAGTSSSRYYPVVVGPVSAGGSVQPQLSGSQSGVVTVLDHTGKVLNSTYFGVQAADDVDSKVGFASLAIDSRGNILVGGSFDHLQKLWNAHFLAPNSYPITPNAYMPLTVAELLNLNGFVGITDAVMTKFDSTLSTVLYSVVDGGAGTCRTGDAQRIYHTTGERVGVDADDTMHLLMLTNAYCMYTTDQAVQRQASGYRDAVLLKVAADGYKKGTTTPAFEYQGYLGFGPGSITNHCALAVANDTTVAGSSTAYIGCNLVGARRRSLASFAASQISREDVSADDAQPVFSGENIFVVRLESSDTASRIAYTTGFGGTYANSLGDVLLNSTNTALYFTGSTLSADFPVMPDAYDHAGSTQRDGVLGILDTTP